MSVPQLDRREAVRLAYSAAAVAAFAGVAAVSVEAELRSAERVLDLGCGGGLCLCRASAELLPLAGGSVDVVLVKVIFNLNPARPAIFGELARVVRPGGRVYAAELVLRAPLPPSEVTEASWLTRSPHVLAALVHAVD